MIHQKIESICPHCGKENRFENLCVGKGCMAKLRCLHCGEPWQEDIANGFRKFTKAAPSTPSACELAALRAQVLAQFEELSKLINGIIERRNAAARKFQPNGVEKSDVAQTELAKALANGKPLTPAPGARIGAATGDEATAWNELGKALDNPRRGFGDPFEGEGAGRPGFRPRESVTVVASSSANDEADENGVRTRSGFEPR